MRAAPGAIEYIQLSDGGLRIQATSSAPAVGLCGSGADEPLDVENMNAAQLDSS
jgi:hypothetical protein